MVLHIPAHEADEFVHASDESGVMIGQVVEKLGARHLRMTARDKNHFQHGGLASRKQGIGGVKGMDAVSHT
jgi:hypothetical protein